MSFYFQTKDGVRREMTTDEVWEHMSAFEISEALDAKRSAPAMEVIYMTVGGYIVVDFRGKERAI